MNKAEMFAGGTAGVAGASALGFLLLPNRARLITEYKEASAGSDEELASAFWDNEGLIVLAGIMTIIGLLHVVEGIVSKKD